MAKIKGVNKNGEVINGLGSDDHIVALGGNDTIYGGDGNDHINAGAGDDHVTGGAGNDLLHGNGGADTFYYSFTVVPGSGSTTNFGSFDPGADEELSQTEFAHQYDAWLALLGTDENDDGEIDVVNNGGSETASPVVEGFDGTFSAKTLITVHTGGSNVQPRYYSGSATTSGGNDTLTSGDGHDIIADFHVGLDKLNFGGVDLDYFAIDDSDDVNDDGVNDTVITISGYDGFSITLLGVNDYDLSAFFV